MPKRVLFLFSDTGGGHRSAAEAIREALTAAHGAAVQVEMVDVFKDYLPPPFNRSADWYAEVARKRPWEWGLSYTLTNGPRRWAAFNALTWPWVRAGVQRCLAEHPADVIVAVHPVLTKVIHALPPSRPPFLTVVTDLVTGHITWFEPTVDACLVPSEGARQLARRHGLAEEKLQVIGLPVAARFSHPPADKAALKQRLGWGTTQPTVLVVGGGDGIGPLYAITHAVAGAGLRCEVAVVCGRNEELRARLLAERWPMPVHVYGFVREMPDFMGAADVLASKAGPGTICEALIAGLPLVLYSRLPGQEQGNVDYVVGEGAGVWAPTPEAVVVALRQWIGPDADPAALKQVSARARRLGRPEAARDIARVIWEWAGRR